MVFFALELRGLLMRECFVAHIVLDCQQLPFQREVFDSLEDKEQLQDATSTLYQPDNEVKETTPNEMLKFV